MAVHRSSYLKTSLAKRIELLPDFKGIESRERVMVLAPDWKKDFKTISAVDVYTDKELNNSFELCIDEVCEHENQRLHQYTDFSLAVVEVIRGHCNTFRIIRT